MADEIDRASEYEDKAREAAISNVRNTGSHLPHTGYCYYCAEPIEAPNRFCDAGCRDSYELENRMRSISGKR